MSLINEAVIGHLNKMANTQTRNRSHTFRPYQENNNKNQLNKLTIKESNKLIKCVNKHIVNKLFSRIVNDKPFTIKVRLEDASVASLIEEYLNDDLLPIPYPILFYFSLTKEHIFTTFISRNQYHAAFIKYYLVLIYPLQGKTSSRTYQ